MLTQLYRRSPVGFALACIAVYAIFMGLGDTLSACLGAAYSGNMLLAALLAAALLCWSDRSGLRRALGLCRPRGGRRVLWYVPLAAVAACNLIGWRGYPAPAWETAFAAAAMLLAGLLEELLFRGLLLGALGRMGPRRAVWLSAIAFGLGHLLNLLGGADAWETATQGICAVAVGVMLALLALRCGSILPGALMHGALNVLGVLSAPSEERAVLIAALMTVISAVYAAFLQPSGEKNEK